MADNEVHANLERQFDALRDTATSEELEQLEAARGAHYYGHDLVGAIRRGYARKLDACLDEAESWLTKTITADDPSRLSSERVFWHLLMRLIRRAHAAGVDYDTITVRLKRASDVVNGYARREARADQ